MNKKTGINITEIAKRANVSIATVSRVLNNPEKVKKETRKKILDLIESSNYIRNTLGLQLRTNKTYTIGFINTSLKMDFYSKIAQGIETTARKKDYNLIFSNSNDDPEIEKKQLIMLIEKRVDGIVIAPTSENVNLLKKIQNNKTPICCIDRFFEDLDCNYVLVDNYNSTYNVTNILIQKGYKNIGYISAPLSISTGTERIKGYKKAIIENSLQYNENLIRYGDSFIDSGNMQTLDLLKKEKIDCLFVANELMGVGALQAIKSLNMKIPDDLGFIMWDDPFWTKLCDPQISAISQPNYEMGSIAAETLINSINPENHNIKPLTITLNTTLIERNSLK